jgi:hypothetical protein
LKNDKINTQEKLNIVLSPSFYWFKQEQLPVKNATQAKKLIPSQWGFSYMNPLECIDNEYSMYWKEKDHERDKTG